MSSSGARYTTTEKRAMTKFNLLLKGSSLQLLESLVAIATGLITLPLMLKYLGTEQYGVWVLVGGFTGLLYIFDLGFASSVTRGVASTIAVKDVKKTNGIINSALLIYSILAIVIMIAVAVAALVAHYNPIDAVSSQDLQLVILLIGLSIAIEFPFKAFAGITTAYLRYDLVAIYKILTKLISTGVLFYLLLNGFGLVSIAILHVLTSIVSNLFFLYMAKSVFKEMKISSTFIKMEVVKELFHYSSWAFLIDINRIIKERVDLFFIGGFISLTAVSIYYVPLRLVEYSMQMLYKSLNLSLPILTGNSSLGDEVRFRENLILFNRINVYFSALSFLFFLFVGETIIYYWMGSAFDYHTAYQILLVLLAGRLAALSSNGFNTALYAKARHKIIAYTNIGETLLTTLLLALFLIYLSKGAVWAAIAISVPLIAGRLFILPLIATTIMKMTNVKEMLIFSFRPLVLLILGGALYLLYPATVELSFSHAYRLGILFVLFLIFAFLDLNPRERDYIKLIFARFKKAP